MALTDFIGIGGSLLGAGANAIAQGSTNRANKQMNRENNEARQRLAEYEFTKNKEMWNENNLYNSPTAQMKRFSDAGLNKNLIYGQGTAGNSTSTPSYQAPQQERHQNVAPDIGNALSMYQDFKLNQAQVDNIRANTDNAKTQNAIQLLQSKGLKDDYTNDRLSKTLANQLLLSQNDASRATTAQIAKDYDLRKQQYGLSVDKYKTDTHYKSRSDQRDSEKHSWARREYDDLKSYGIYPGDSIWARLLLKGWKWYNDAGQPLKKILPK